MTDEVTIRRNKIYGPTEILVDGEIFLQITMSEKSFYLSRRFEMRRITKGKWTEVYHKNLLLRITVTEAPCNMLTVMYGIGNVQKHFQLLEDQDRHINIPKE